MIENILIVEDDDSHAYLSRYVLESVYSDAKVDHVWDGKEALDYLLERIASDQLASLPDLIMLDINMPKIDGFNFLEAVKEDERIPNLFIVMLSSSSLDTDIARAHRLGAADFLVKPLDPQLLIKAVSAKTV